MFGCDIVWLILISPWLLSVLKFFCFRKLFGTFSGAVCPICTDNSCYHLAGVSSILQNTIPIIQQVTSTTLQEGTDTDYQDVTSDGI